MCLIKTAYRGWVQLGDGKVCVNSNDVQGVYRPVHIQEAIAANTSRADRFCHALHNDQYGGSFRGKEFDDRNRPMCGAYGEKL